MLRLTCVSAIGVLLAGAVSPSDAADGPKRKAWSSQRGRLGVSLADVEAADVGRLKLKEETGARISSVSDDSPASSAGLKEDDVVLRYQGEAVHSASQLARLVRETPAGRKVALEISRQGAVQQVSATLGEGRALAFGDLGELPVPPEPPAIATLPEMPDLPDMPEIPELPAFRWNQRDRDQLGDQARDEVRRVLRSRGPRLGIRYHELSDQLASYFKVDGGVLVASVDEDSPAARAGLKAGDVIVKVNGRKVEDSSDLGAEVARMSSDAEATLTVQRDGKPLDLKVRVADARPRRVPRGPTT
jgi:S1-C subfamily serine protease